MESLGSETRTLRPEDFSAEQVERWCAAGASRHDDRGTAGHDERVTEWVAVYTNPKREDDVSRELTRRSFVTYAPAMTVTKRRRDVLRPLLPRHVFIGFRGSLSFLDLDQTPGLEGVVRMGLKPATVQPEVVDLLREREIAGDFDFSDYKMARLAECAKQRERLKKLADLESGYGVEIRTGPYLSFRGTYDRQLDEERVSIKLTLFGREFPIPIALDHVQVVMARR